MRDYFQILGVPHNAGAAAIRQAYRRLSRRDHPDISGDGVETGDTPTREAARGEIPRDEIAIDFPSVHPLIDRMREAFFAPGTDEASRWSAYIELSRGEARNGARVPIDVPHTETCGACGGRGEIWTDRCADCAGRGTRPASHRVRLVLPAGLAHGAELVYQLRMPAGPPAVISVSVGINQAWS